MCVQRRIFCNKHLSSFLQDESRNQRKDLQKAMVPFVKLRYMSQYHISSNPFGSSPTLAQVVKFLACILYLIPVHHKSIIYNKPTRRNSGSIVFINNCRYALHISNALWVQGRLSSTKLGHLYRIYSIPTHDKHQWLLLQFTVLLMMEERTSETCRAYL